MKRGEKVSAPEADEIIPVSNDPELTFRVAGWYLENGQEWDFDEDVVKENMTLYPVWEVVSTDVSGNDAGGTATKKFYTVICRETWGGIWNSEADRYVCLPEGTRNIPNTGIENAGTFGWEKVYEEGEDEKMWDQSKDSVKGVTVLKIKMTVAPSSSPEP